MGNSEEEEKRIREYLKKVDKDYYRPDIKGGLCNLWKLCL